MKLAFSNLAWDAPAADEQMFALLRKELLTGIELAPGKIFPDLSNITDEQIQNYRAKVETAGLQITGFQSLLFGRPELQVFGDDQTKQALLEHLEILMKALKGLGGRVLVFGSPRNRDRGGRTDSEATKEAAEFFTQVGKSADFLGVKVCLEANPPIYNCNFLTTTQSVFDFVQLVNSPGIGFHLDTGAMLINEEKSADFSDELWSAVEHVHLSTAQLQVPHEQAFHQALSQTLKQKNYQHFVSVEMLPPQNSADFLGALDLLKLYQ